MLQAIARPASALDMAAVSPTPSSAECTVRVNQREWRAAALAADNRGQAIVFADQREGVREHPGGGLTLDHLKKPRSPSITGAICANITDSSLTGARTITGCIC